MDIAHTTGKDLNVLVHVTMVTSMILRPSTVFQCCIYNIKKNMGWPGYEANGNSIIMLTNYKLQKQSYSNSQQLNEYTVLVRWSIDIPHQVPHSSLAPTMGTVIEFCGRAKIVYT